MEYVTAPFGITDGIYPSLFFVLTGFHGLHVIIGTLFIMVSFYRAANERNDILMTNLDLKQVPGTGILWMSCGYTSMFFLHSILTQK